MKRPLLNRQERVSVYCETLNGALLEVRLATSRLRRDVYNSHGWISMKKAERIVTRMANMTLLGMDNKRKWYQIF